jgi:hypothetical protein
VSYDVSAVAHDLECGLAAYEVLIERAQRERRPAKAAWLRKQMLEFHEQRLRDMQELA